MLNGFCTLGDDIKVIGLVSLAHLMSHFYALAVPPGIIPGSE